VSSVNFSQIQATLEDLDFFFTGGNVYFAFAKADNTNLGEYEICFYPMQLDGTGEKSRGDDTTSYTMVPVFYATDRADTRDREPCDRYTGDLAPDHKLYYGVSKVSIPATHEVGQIESPSMWRFEMSEDPNKHVVLHYNRRLPKGVFFNLLSNKIAKSDRKKTFMFIHGYNVSFCDAAKRTAQIKYDLKFDGEAVLYSWPSQASTSSYTIDENNIEWAVENIKNFLVDYLTKTPAEEVYLIAHSMGNRGLTKALLDLGKTRPELTEKIHEIILAAPDIDAALFKRTIAPQMVELIKKPITLYVSADDKALEASKAIHGRPRAGDAEYGIVTVDGMETVDATGIDASFLSHSYFAETNSIIQDMINLITAGKRAAKRAELKKVTTADGTYWKIEK
jgi:esterase/lipase superfamily enzyme